MVDASLPDPALPASLAHFGALLGDPVRAAILLHLSDGSWRPAGELATLAGVSPQAVSAHLARLVEGGLLRSERQGRHRFFALASGEMAEVLEGLGNALAQPRRGIAHPPQLREARLCYDHVAGRLGVALFDRMTALGFFAFDQGGPSLGEAGTAWCHRIGLALESRPGSRRPLLRPCLDWTERRHHMGGLFGAALTTHLLGAGLLTPGPGPRSLRLTGRGAAFLRHELGLCGLADPA
ncbi:MAG: helix-turn-helix transcriptional regulator [Caulobacteraceae bacterium]|nr:helix-turn-helix transcriptional regulator [Caulobacter sp.]